MELTQKRRRIMALEREKIGFLNLPTPLSPLPRMSEELGVCLYIKRDDLTDIGMGGNKLRKLEYYLADARSQGATMLLTVGGAQTNHGRLTAAVAAKFGFGCAICALDDWPGELSSNLLLDRIFGAQVHLRKPVPGGDYDGQLDALVAEVRAAYEARGERVYFIPMGGSGIPGIPGYYNCALELAGQCRELGLPRARVFVALGSMGTYMGLFTGIKNEALPFSLEGVLIGPFYRDVRGHALSYYESVRSHYRLSFHAGREDFVIHENYVFGAYNNAVPEIREAVEYMARREGILLDPCYTGKAFYGLRDLVRKGVIRPGETVVFLHTGGQPGVNGPNHRKAWEAGLMDGIHLD
jgi:1-aminocyclopropane-1-carboxylate deaminase/D-cysteine desulfhydrase-like pyridoxal-dependent ACC family enzyme